MNCGLIGGHSRGAAGGVVSEGAVVVTVTVNGADVGPFSATDAGATVQTANEGAPAHPSPTVPVKPFSEETCKLYVAVCPSVTVAVVEPPAAEARAKSVALPVSLTVCGLPPALSVMLKEPVLLPLAVGANLTLNVQFAPGATAVPQVLD